MLISPVLWQSLACRGDTPTEAPDCCEDDASQRSVQHHQAHDEQAAAPDHCGDAPGAVIAPGWRRVHWNAQRSHELPTGRALPGRAAVC